MQVPSLVTRLAKLHSSLTSRLALQPTLLALNGRLDLVMSQIELRQEKIAASSIPRVQSSGGTGLKGKKYVEGESSESEDDDDEEEEDDDSEGSVEDVILGSDHSELSSGEDDDDEDDLGFSDEEAEGIAMSGKGGKVNGKSMVLDDEEVESEDDEEESEEESEDEESD